MNAVKIELQDLSFRYLQPNSYAQMRQDVEEHLPARDRYVAETIGEISGAFEENSSTSSISTGARSTSTRSL